MNVLKLEYFVSQGKFQHFHLCPGRNEVKLTCLMKSNRIHGVQMGIIIISSSACSWHREGVGGGQNSAQ